MDDIRAREKKLPKVRTTQGTMESFDATKIIESLITEAHLSRANAQLIAVRVMDRIVASGIKFLSGPLIREMCNSVLAEMGFEQERIEYTRVGIPMWDLNQLINDPGDHTSNANLMRNPETIAKLVHDQVMEQHTYLSIPSHLADAHLKGDIYIKDREYFSTRDYCATWDLRQVLKLGIAPDGLGGMHSSAAGPAQHLHVAVNHSAIWLAAAQSSFSVTPEQEVLISDEEGTRLVPIGPFVDRVMKQKPCKQIPQVNGEVADTTGDGLFTYAFNPETMMIERKEINRVIRHPISDDVCRIRTRTGREIRCTGSHSLFTLENGNVKPIAVNNLKEGDLIAIPRVLPHGDGPSTLDIGHALLELGEDKTSSVYVKGVADQLSELEEWERRRNSVSLSKVRDQNYDIDFSGSSISLSRSSYELPAEIDISTELSRFLGYFAAEGHIGLDRHNEPNTIVLSFGVHEKHRIEDAKECIQNVWDADINVQRPHKTELQLVICNKLVALIMTEILGTGRNSKDKRIPPVVLSGSAEIKWGFLNGYFCDGHVHRRSVKFTSVTEGLSTDLLYLLLQLGIIARQRPHISSRHKLGKRTIRESVGYRTSIYGRENLQRFAAHIPDITTEDFQYKTRHLTTTSLPDAIPIEKTNVRELIDKMGVPHTHGRIPRINTIFQKQHMAPGLFCTVLDQLAEFSETPVDYSDEIESLRHLTCGDVAFDIVEVIERESFEGQVYDLSVDGYENFIGGHGGIILHNSGGQGYFFYNTFLAPFMAGKSYKKIKQAAQQLIFTLTQQYVARGGQVIFSSVDLTPGIPKIMRDVPAVLPGGKQTEMTYGDFEEEANQFFDAFMEVMISGDVKGKGFNFPKPNIVLREEFMGPEYDESWRKVAELTAKFGSPYFENYLNWRSSIEAGCSSCCSHLWTASSDEEMEEFLSGNMVFGASQMVTPNFGRAAWIGRSDENRFLEKVDEYIDLSKEVVLEKKGAMDKLIASGSVPFYTQPKPNGDPLINMETREFLLGTVGFEEMAHIMTGHHLHEREGTRFGIKVLKHLKKRADEFQEETGLHFGVTRTPAESAAGRLARKDYNSYPGIRKYLKGDMPSVYYTNSTTLDVAADLPLSDRIKKEGMFHPFMDGGALTHIYLGEANPDPDALWALTKKIAKSTLNSYWAFTKDQLWCKQCNYQAGIDWRHTKFDSINDLDNIPCPRCGYVGVEIYSRITGYLQGTSVFNDSKKQEFIDRHRYNI